jgi:NAD(P)-dependent dehydrogenase (short-subunit alcohol dehydrogenase family)
VILLLTVLGASLNRNSAIAGYISLLDRIVAGRRIERVIEARAAAVGVDYETMEKEYLGKVSRRRMLSAQDIADMVLFLCSPAGRNISGQSLSVCGNVETL